MAILCGDDQCIGHGRLSRSFQRRGYLVIVINIRPINSGRYNDRYDDDLFDHILAVMEAAVASQSWRQGGQFENYNGRRMSGRAFELAERVKDLN